MKWIVTDTLRGDRVGPYVAWLDGANIRSRVLSPTGRVPDDLRDYSALLLTGGGDVDPSRYNAKRDPETAGVDGLRDRREIELIQAFLQSGKAVFGVCRGIQMLNVALRGRLIQHLPSRIPADVEEHRQMDGRDSRHGVKLVPGSLLAEALPTLAEVNSSHHQAVDPEALGNGLRVAALSPAGVVEAVEGEGLDAPVLAVQWHPERMERGPGSDGLLRFMAELSVGGGR